MKEPRAAAEPNAVLLLGGLAVAAALRVCVVAGDRSRRPWTRPAGRGRCADLPRDPTAAGGAGCPGRRLARPVGRGAAGLSAQSAGRAEPGRRFGRRGAGCRADHPSGAERGGGADLAAGSAARRCGGDAGGGGARRQSWRAGDADPGRPRRIEHRHRARVAGAQRVAEPVRDGGDGVLADGLAGRPQPAAGVARRPLHAGRASPCCCCSAARSMR